MNNFTNKPESDWDDIDKSTKAAWDFFGADDERKVHCKECGEYWYESHYKNGYCHSCQQKGFHLTKEISLETLIWRVIVVLVIITFLLIIS
jgi:hypothetical protein